MFQNPAGKPKKPGNSANYILILKGENRYTLRMLLRLRTLLPSAACLTLVFLAIGLASTAFAQLLYVPAYGTNWLTEYTTDPGPRGRSPQRALRDGAPASAPANSIATGEPAGGRHHDAEWKLPVCDRQGTGSVIAIHVNDTRACLGKLAPLATYTLGGQPCGAAIDASGTYLFVAQVGYGSDSY